MFPKQTSLNAHEVETNRTEHCTQGCISKVLAILVCISVSSPLRATKTKTITNEQWPVPGKPKHKQSHLHRSDRVSDSDFDNRTTTHSITSTLGRKPCTALKQPLNMKAHALSFLLAWWHLSAFMGKVIKISVKFQRNVLCSNVSLRWEKRMTLRETLSVLCTKEAECKSHVYVVKAMLSHHLVEMSVGHKAWWQ